MSNTNNIMDLINAGIQLESTRQKAIANNFANFETPGYRRVDVKFKELLDACLGSSDGSKLSRAEPEIYEPRMTPVKGNGNDTSMEVEVGQMIKNSLRHKTYVLLLKKKASQIELAIGAR